jgi:hypothetical protein
MSPRTAHNGLPVALALCALAAPATLATLSGCTYVEKNYYYGDLDTGAEPSEPADSGGADSAEPEPPAPIDLQLFGEYTLPETGGEPRTAPITLALRVPAEGALEGALRTESSGFTDVVYSGVTWPVQLELSGTGGAEGQAAGTTQNVAAGAIGELPQPWTGSLVVKGDGVVRLEAEGDLTLDVFGVPTPYPFTLWAEVQPEG